MQTSHVLWQATAVAIAGVLMVAPARAADDRGRASSAADSQDPATRPDFMLGKPRGSIGIRGSWVFPRAGSDLFDFVTEQLTLDKSDFNAPGIGADLTLALTPRVDTQIGFSWNRTSAPSEYRDFVDNDFLPIEQSTSLKTVELTGSIRFSLTPPGRAVSRFAWVPRRAVPYVGAGGGTIYYDFLQRGDFVDYADSSVFADVFRSRGWAPSAHAFVGVDVQLYRSLYATVEGRYTKSSATLGPDFIDFDPIDLSGFRLSTGINVVF